MMKELIILNSDDGFIVEEVDGRSCKFCSSAFTYKDEHGFYRLVDRDSGMMILKCKQLKNVESSYKRLKRTYDSYRKTDTYKIKVERFEKMKLISKYERNK